VEADEEDTMSSEEQIIYKVVVNDEEQYSIWFADREIPPGWKESGKVGPKAECLAYIEEVWTDMRPLSLRKWMEEQAAKEAAEANEAPPKRQPS
jgi:MbtH protein